MEERIMGQRLIINFKEEENIIASAYSRDSGHTQQSISLLFHAIEEIISSRMWDMNIYDIVRVLHYMDFSIEEKELSKLPELYEHLKEFSIEHKEDKIILLDNESIKEYNNIKDYEISIDVTNNTFSFNVLDKVENIGEGVVYIPSIKDIPILEVFDFVNEITEAIIEGSDIIVDEEVYSIVLYNGGK